MTINEFRLKLALAKARKAGRTEDEFLADMIGRARVYELRTNRDLQMDVIALHATDNGREFVLVTF